MIGKSLQSWLKEFATLVFTQTIQAFIYAIIISIIINGMNPDNAFAMDAADQNAALGMISIIALTSVFKVEDLMRKVLGLGTSQASVKGAMGSIAKTAIALKLGSRVLNNGVKAGKGVAQFSKGKADLRKANSKFSEASKANEDALKRGKSSLDDTKTNADASYDAEVASIKAKYMEKDFIGPLSEEDKANGGKISEEGKAKLRVAELKRDSIKNQAEERFADKRVAIHERYKALADENKAKKSEILKSQREGVKMIASSGLETGGALFGGTAGAIIGGAHGDLGEAGQGLLAGVGIGDAVGESIANTAGAGVEAANSTIEYTKKYFEDIDKRAEKYAMQNTGGSPKRIKAMQQRFKDNRYFNQLKEYNEKIEKAYRDAKDDL